MARNQTISSQTLITANGQKVVLDVRDLNTAILSVHGTGTFTIAFEGSDDNGVTYYPIQVARMNTNVIETSYANVNGSQLWETSVHLLTHIRMNITAFTSSTTGTVGLGGSPIALEPAPNSQPTPTAQAVTATPVTASGHTLTSAATTNATSVKTTAGHLFELTVDNMAATPRFLKLYNKASAPTVGTDVPVMTFDIPANGFRQLEFGQLGKRFTTGLAYAITAAQAVADATAIGAGEVHVAASYL